MGLRSITLSMAGCMAVVGALVSLPTGAGAQSTPRCHSGDLVGAIIDRQGGAGSRDARLILTNKSSRTCHSKGFIGGQLIGLDDHPLTTHVHRDHGTPARTVVIKSGAAAALTLHWNVIPSGTTPCRVARWMRVTPPDDTTTLRVYFRDTACRGEISVGPLTNPSTV
jgi:hypothetical protein